MPVPIKITLGNKVVLKGELFDSPSAEAIKECIPFEVTLDRWGKELYGVLNKEVKEFSDKEQEVMEVGDLAYHKQTGWFCIFWGSTPSSKGNEPRAAVSVCRIGRVNGDWEEVEELSVPVKGVVEFA